MRRAGVKPLYVKVLPVVGSVRPIVVEVVIVVVVEVVMCLSFVWGNLVVPYEANLALSHYILSIRLRRVAKDFFLDITLQFV